MAGFVFLRSSCIYVVVLLIILEKSLVLGFLCPPCLLNSGEVEECVKDGTPPTVRSTSWQG